MKYLTKELYKLGGETDYTLCMKKIRQKEYSEAEIKKFYNKELIRRITEYKREYNSAPDDDYRLELLDEIDFNLEDWSIIDEETGFSFKPTTKTELRDYLEAEQDRMMRDFANREPFDADALIRDFNEVYMGAEKHLRDHYPEWIFEEVDSRLLALGLIPADAYRRLKVEEEKNSKEYDRMIKHAWNAINREEDKLPSEIAAALEYHDAAVLAIQPQGNDIEMLLAIDGECRQPEITPYTRVVLQNSTFLEFDDNICIEHTIEPDGDLRSDCHFLYREIYLTEKGNYEVHLMVWNNGPKYITFLCSGLDVEDNLKAERIASQLGIALPLITPKPMVFERPQSPAEGTYSVGVNITTVFPPEIIEI